MAEQKKDYMKDGKSYYQGGVFYPDQTPLEIPLGYTVPETLEAMIARMVHNEHIYHNPEIDNIDEADDLDVMDEEPILVSRHEFTEMQEEHYTKAKKQAFDSADAAITQSQSPPTKPQGETIQPVQPVQHGKEAAQ